MLDNKNYYLSKEINLLENKKIAIKLNIYALVMLVFFILLFIGISTWLIPIKQYTFWDNLGFFRPLLFIGLFFLIIVIHELIHGLFMKLFNKKGKVIFGFKNGMAYAASPGSLYSRGQFFGISLSPFIFITTTLCLLYYFGIISHSLFISLTALHASSCVGDFYWGLLIIRATKHAQIEDTDVGIKIYQKQENML